MPTPPAANWTLGGVGVYVNADEPVMNPIIARLHPISATTDTLQYIGAESQGRRLSGHIYTESNRTSIETNVKAGTTMALVSDKGSQGNYVALGFTARRRQALGYSDVWYEFTIELVKQ